MRRRGWVFAPVAALWVAALGADALRDWLATAPVPPLLVETSVEVTAKDGQLLRAYLTSDGYWRLPTRAAEVDPLYLAMLMAYEDKRFYSHGGVDSRAALRAAGQALRHGEIRSGASTLTMQTARLLMRQPTRRWQAKAAQVRLALALEQRLSKSAILGLYLQRAPFGGNLEGLASACHAWFAKPCRRLSHGEAALLVALPQSPEARKPDENPARAKAARDRVLARALAAGLLTPADHDRAESEPVLAKRHAFPAHAPHLADRALALAPEAATHRLSLDPAAQTALQDLARRSLAAQPAEMQIALLAVETQTGRIVASVGSAGITGPRAGFVDMTRALRSPGSTLKPLVYGLAFDAGRAHPESLIDDHPIRFGTYAPQNFDGLYRGRLPVREALQLSLNTPVVALTDEIGPARLLQAMRQAGMAPALPGGTPGLALALGGVGVSLEDLVALYAGIASGGIARPLYWQEGPPPEHGKTRFLGPVPAFYVTDILRGLPPPEGSKQGDIAYKTGTSYGHRDAWAIGYDGAHTIGVWMGRPDATPVPGAFGGDLAAPVLFEAFARIAPRRTPFPPPPPGALMLNTAQLPEALRYAAGAEARQGPEMRFAFPPQDAALLPGLPLIARLQHGEPPFTWLANGRPLPPTRARHAEIPLDGPGFHALTVIDATGSRARVDFRLLPED
ncbi:penicillin-binding protein 1C [Pseudoruegeria sp. SHC-113]|uniref:penicillin-binding protein 1C n=1 Tax=Pseudoruegeria sp. SHC-113 TaxID=2855439 RepID=UPI0021BB6AA6|nr:penicillin-binding protein 1C [Pseudoruegeria sp. SHC-113]MCT8158801.1 penicillin-binding protein 1C [Pseudoruegeria sp. SHC-113]